MYWFYCFCMGAVALVVVYLLWYYPNTQTTFPVKLIVGLAWFASLSVLILVPEDVALSVSGASKHKEILGAEESTLGKFWAVVYWSAISFIICVLPFLQKYSDSGGFSIRDRGEYAFRANLKLLALVIGMLSAGFLILYLAEGEIKFGKFVGWLMAVLNAYGLIGAICLMGYGMIDIPRKLWQKANHTERQNFLFQSAGLQLEKTEAAHLELSKQYNSVRRFDGLFGMVDPMRPYMDVIVAMLDRVPDFQPQLTEEGDDVVKMDTNSRQGLGLIRQRLRKGIEGYQRERQRYISLVREYVRLQETMENEKRHGWAFVFQDERPRHIAVRYWSKWWRCYIKPFIQRVMALITAALSILIVVAEVSISDFLPNLSVFAHLLKSVKSNEGAVIGITFLILFYAMTCMYYTLIRLGRFSFYQLVPKHTAPFSLVSNALLLSRFVCPLCFNFLTAIALPIKEKGDDAISVKRTQFWDRIGRRISEMPLFGKYFTTYIPIFILPYVILIFFKSINRVMSFLDRKLKFTFKDDWEMEPNSNYASNGRTVLNLEVEYFLRGFEPGLTVTEGARQAGVPSSATACLTQRSPDPFSRQFNRSSTPKPDHEASESTPFMRRSSSLDASAIRTRPPNIPDTAQTEIRPMGSATRYPQAEDDRQGRQVEAARDMSFGSLLKFFSFNKNERSWTVANDFG